MVGQAGASWRIPHVLSAEVHHVAVIGLHHVCFGCRVELNAPKP